MQLTRNPTPQAAKVVRWSDLVTGGVTDNDIVDTSVGEDHRGINNDLEAGESRGEGDEENQQQLGVGTLDLGWAKSKLPSFNFSKRRRMNDLPLRVQLYQAAQNGDWNTAKQMESKYQGILTLEISDRCETALHIATRAKKAGFVEELVKFLGRHDLALKNKYGNTALCIAAASGAVDIAELMVRKYEALPLIRGSGNSTPVLIAARYKHKDMVSYLLSQTPIYGLSIQEQMELLVGAISADYYVQILGHGMVEQMWKVVLDMIPENKTMQKQGHEMVEQMWKVVLDMIPENEVLHFVQHPSSMLHDAARVGNVEFLRVLINSYPDIAWKVDSERKSIFHVAVENRQKGVFSLIYEMGEFLDYLPSYFDEDNISLLELAAKKADPNHLNRVSGAAFQMHRELLCFKEVEKIVELTMRRKKGKQNPRDLFTQEHKDLVEEGEKWMKKTANSCMLVATLIATVVFAAVFTVPGGNDNNNNFSSSNNNNTGSPLFLHHKWFTVFVISDATALISSSTSILLFLSILTSRCAEEDFLIWLPLKLVFGLGTLFLSVVTMVLAFTATFFLFYGKDTAWVPLLVAGMAIVPVYCFGVLQFRLWADALAALQATYYLYFRNWKAILF